MKTIQTRMLDPIGVSASPIALFITR